MNSFLKKLTLITLINIHHGPLFSTKYSVEMKNQDRSVEIEGQEKVDWSTVIAITTIAGLTACSRILFIKLKNSQPRNEELRKQVRDLRLDDAKLSKENGKLKETIRKLQRQSDNLGVFRPMRVFSYRPNLGNNPN